jgi:hypothetical protein
MGTDWPPSTGNGNPPASSSEPALPSGRQSASRPMALSRPFATTSQLRERLRTDAMQQAVSELSVLTEQLLELPGRLKEASLAALRNRQYVEAVEAFVDLAKAAWEAMATDTLQDTIASQDYRLLAVTAGRRVNRLQQEVATLSSGTWAGHAARGGKRAGPLGNERAQRIAEALGRWRIALGVSQGRGPSITDLGLALDDLRAAVGYASQDNATLLLQHAMTLGGQAIGGIVGLLLIANAAGAIAQNQPHAAQDSLVAGFVALVWIYSLLLSSRGRFSLWYMAAGARRRLQEDDRTAGLIALAVWRWVAQTLAVLGIVAATVWVGIQLRSAARGIFTAGQAMRAFVDALSVPSHLALLSGLAGAVLLVPLVVALPATITYQVQLARQLAGDDQRAPVARRVPLDAALAALATHTLVVLVASLGVLMLTGNTQPLATIAGVALTWQSIDVAAASILLYLLAIAVPYRTGIARWRSRQLALLGERTRDVTSKLSRLGDTPVLEEDVTTMQYSVARLQYFHLQEEDARREPGTPYAPIAVVVALLTALAVAVGAGDALLRLASTIAF